MIMKNLKSILPDVIAVVFFAVLSYLYFFPADSEGRILAQHDSIAGIGAGQEAKEYQEKTGNVTRWTNALFGGMPTYQMAPSYNSTDTLKTAENIYHLYLPSYVYLVFIMLLGFYILLRAFNFKVWMSALGAVIWAFLPISLSLLLQDISGSSSPWRIFRRRLPVWCLPIRESISRGAY